MTNAQQPTCTNVACENQALKNQTLTEEGQQKKMQYLEQYKHF